MKEFFKNLPDETTPYEADRFNDLLNGEESMGSIVVEDIKSKNLFDKNDIKFGYWVNNDGVLTESNPMCCTNYFIKVKPNTKYTFSSGKDNYPQISEYNNSKEFIKTSGVDATSAPYTLTTTNNTEYVIVSCLRYNLDTTQFEKGPVATDYSKYIDFSYDKKYGNYNLLFSGNIYLGNTYNLSDTLQNYRYIIFMLYTGGNSKSTIYSYDALHMPGYIGRVELSCYENGNSFTEIIMDLEISNDTTVICTRSGFRASATGEFGNNPYGLQIYGIY